MRISSIRLLGAIALAIATVAPAAADNLTERANRGLVEIITDSVAGSSARIVEDLADVLDDGATRRILPVVGKGSFQDLADLKVLRGVDVAIVQTDVLDYAKSRRLIPALETVTYIAKLYNEELHVLARGNIKTIADLAGKKVNLGSQGEGSTLTGARVFEMLKIKVEATAFTQALALEKLRTGEIEAMVFVAGKPAPLFITGHPENGLHFLSIPLKQEIATAYIPARLTAEDYPSLVSPQSPVDTVAVGMVMVVAGLAPDSERYRNVANFVEAFFTQFPRLQDTPHHPKWNEVNLAAELPGWRRFAPADSWIKRNGAAPAVALSEGQLREIFAKFLDERSKAANGQTLTAQQKDQLFDQFRRWQGGQSR